MSEHAPSPDDLVGPAKQHRISPRLQAGLVLVITLAMIVAVIVGAGVNFSQSRVIAQQQSLIADLSHNLDATRDQVKATGETPVSPPASVVAGAAGDPGKAGTNGIDGTDGRDGTSVTSVICQASGSWLITYSNGSTQQATGPCIGANGADGQSVTGAPGKDGANGTNGTNGVDGRDGTDGAPGEPPFSWTWVSTSGLSRTCNRTEPFDKTAPTYTCTTTP